MLNFSRKNFLRVSLVLLLPLFLALFFVVLPLFLSPILFPPFFMRHKLKYRRVYSSYDFKSAVIRAENGFLSRVLRDAKEKISRYTENPKEESKTRDRVNSAFTMRPVSSGRDYAKVQSDRATCSPLMFLLLRSAML